MVAGEAKSKTQKEYDIALQRVKLSAEFSEKSASVSQKIESAMARCKEIGKSHLVDGGGAAAGAEPAAAAVAALDCAPNHQRYMDIMENRRKFLEAVVISLEKASNTVLSEDAMSATELVDLAKLQQALETVIAGGDSDANKYTGNLTALQDTLRNVRGMPHADLLASRAGFSAAEVTKEVTMTALRRMVDDMKLVKAYFIAFVNIKRLAQKSIHEKTRRGRCPPHLPSACPRSSS